MPRTQRFSVTLDGVTHTLVYTRSAFWRHVVLEIDGEIYELPRGEREEPFRLGDEQAVLRIRKDGSAAIFTREGEIPQE
jgi:hypothetical protein